MTSPMHRTTFSLDELAVNRLRTLSKRWRVSQAEVIRRALEAAEKLPYEDAALQALEDYHSRGGLAAEKAHAYLQRWSEDRDDWGRESVQP